MSLLDSILFASNASEYSDNFKKLGINASTLKILGQEDLKLLGIQGESVRQLLLKNVANLQISAE